MQIAKIFNGGAVPPPPQAPRPPISAGPVSSGKKQKKKTEIPASTTKGPPRTQIMVLFNKKDGQIPSIDGGFVMRGINHRFLISYHHLPIRANLSPHSQHLLPVPSKVYR